MQSPVRDRLKSAIEVEQPNGASVARARQSVMQAALSTPRHARVTSTGFSPPYPSQGSAQASPSHSSRATPQRSLTLHERGAHSEERSRSKDSREAHDRKNSHPHLSVSHLDGGNFQNFIGIPIDQLIHKTPIFKECSYDFIETVLMHMKKGLYRPGNSIVEEGRSSPESMFFLLWGTAVVSCMGEKCKTISEGEAFGEAMALGVLDSWSSSVQAETACMVCELPREAIDETLEEFPEEREYFQKMRETHSRFRGDEDSWQVLRRLASFQCCSNEFLRELGSHLDRRIFFAGEEIFSEGSQDGNLYLLDFGAVRVELSGRLVWTEEIPHVRMKLVYSEEIVMPMANTNSGQKAKTRRSNERSEIDEVGDLVKSGPSKENVDDDWGDCYDEETSHEAAVFGEEGLLGISRCTSKAVRAHRTCDVRLLYRSTFLRLLMKYPMDQEVLAPFLNSKQCDVFPLFSLKNHAPFARSCCSQAFFSFLSNHIEERIVPAGQPIVLDNFHKYVHHRVPEANISICRVNRGRVRILKAPPSAQKRIVDPTRVGIGTFDEEVVDQPTGIETIEEQIEEEELGEGGFLYGNIFWRQHHVMALEMCFLSVLHRGVVARALEELPNDREALLHVLAQQGVAKQATSKPRQKNQSKVAKILRERSIFANTSQEFMHEIIECGTTRVFMPGDRIIEQGTDGTSMFILWLGTSHVVTEQMEEDEGSSVRTLTNVGILPYGSVFGELVMLGVHQRRTASIIAATVCCTWEVQHKHCLAILDRHPVERSNFLKLVEEHLDRLAAPRIIYHPLFSSFHQQFRTLVGVNCEKRLSFPGETIVREGTQGDKLYIMNLGTAVVEIHHQHVMKVTGGSHFGFSVMTGALDKYPATVVAETMCQVLIVSNSTYRHALHKYPEMSELAKALEADEKTKQQRQRAIFARMVRRRRGLKCIIEALRGSGIASNAEELNGDRALLEASFQGWRCIMLRTAELRRGEEEQREGNARRIDRWLEKRRVQMEKIKPSNDLKRLIHINVCERGPLKLAKKPLAGVPLQKPKSDSWEESESPYMSPSPVWRKTAISLRQSTKRLPPLAVSAGSPTAKGPWASSGLDSSRFRAKSDSVDPGERSRSHSGTDSPSRSRCRSGEGMTSRALELPPVRSSPTPAATGNGAVQGAFENSSGHRSPRPTSADGSVNSTSSEDIEEEAMRAMQAAALQQPGQRKSVLPDALCFGMGSLPQHVLAVEAKPFDAGAF